MMLMTVPLILFHRVLLDLWLGPEFVSRSAIVLAIFLTGILFNAIAFIPFTYLQGTGRPSVPALLHTAELILYVLILIPAVKYYGIIGAAGAWLIRVLLDFVLQSWAVLKLESPSQDILLSRQVISGMMLTIIPPLCLVISLLLEQTTVLIIVAALAFGSIIVFGQKRVLTTEESKIIRTKIGLS